MHIPTYNKMNSICPTKTQLKLTTIILTGFSSSFGPASGVREGIQKLGNCLSFPVFILDTLSSLLLPGKQYKKNIVIRCASKIWQLIWGVQSNCWGPSGKRVTLEPNFCIVKLGYTYFSWVYLFFLLLFKNIDCGYSLKPPQLGGLTCTSNLWFEQNNKKTSKVFN